MNFDHPIQLATALPGVEPVDNRKGNTVIGNISADHGVKRSCIKLLTIEGIAKEALSAVLASELNLPVKTPCYYVDICNIEPSSRYARKVAFGAIYDQMASFPLNRYPEEELRQWPGLLPAAVFDQWIANNDRLPGNMVYEKKNSYWLFDHDEAFPGYIKPSQPIDSQLLKILVSARQTDFELRGIKKEAMSVVNRYREIDWERVFSLVLSGELPGSEPYFRKYIRFLQERTHCMEAILNEKLGVRQRETDFSNNANF